MQTIRHNGHNGAPSLLKVLLLRQQYEIHMFKGRLQLCFEQVHVGVAQCVCVCVCVRACVRVRVRVCVCVCVCESLFLSQYV